MKVEEKIKMFNDVFAPKTDDKVLFLIDKPHDEIKDNKKWLERREMAKDWYNIFKKIGKDNDFSVDFKEFKATGIHNTPLPKEIIDNIKKSTLVIAMTEFSASASLANTCRLKGSKTRAVSMPMVEKRMEKTAFRANYEDVQKYAENLKKMLTRAISADVLFSTGDKLFIDLRNRTANADGGSCKKPGFLINFPSGEGYIAPYEGVGDEIKKYGESKTNGILPDNQHGDLIKYKVEKNIITEVLGKGKNVDKRKRFFKEDETHRNIAELGIGCNPKAVTTGNILEDEKVGGLHIAYGSSNHIGGKVTSDTHIDICFPKGLPGAVKSLILNNKDGTKIQIIKDSNLLYNLLK